MSTTTIEALRGYAGDPLSSLEEVERWKPAFADLIGFAREFRDELKMRPEFVSEPHRCFLPLHERICELENRIFDACEQGEEHALPEDLEQDLKLFNDAYCAWETELEQRFVDDVETRVVSSSEDYHLYERFRRLINREFGMLPPLKIRRALFIGSGPMPITAIRLSSHCDAVVDCLDVDPHAIERSQRLIEHLGLQDRLRPIHAPENDYAVDQYDVITIALLAKPKKEIIANIVRTMHSKCQVICRTSSGTRSLLYEPTTLEAHEFGGLQVMDSRTVAGSAADTISSLLLAKA